MFKTLEITRMAHALAAHAMARQGAIAQNMAHADTPGYRARDLGPFAETYAAQDGLALRATRPGHLAPAATTATAALRDTGDTPAPNGNSVSLEAEMIRAADTRHQHDLALAVYKSTSSLLRTSLGRSR